MNVYRINLRFDLDDERERMAAEYLQQLPQRGKTTRNRFAVDALCAYISRMEQNDKPLLESIRLLLREEFGGMSIASAVPSVQTVNTELTKEQKEENRRNVLQDLDDLFG